MSQNANGNRGSIAAATSGGRISETPVKGALSKSSNNNEASSESVIQDESGITYRVVHLPNDFFNAAATTASQTLVTQAIDISEAAANNAQPLLVNVGNLSSTPTLAVAGALQTSQMQLQALDTSAAGQQYYIMIPSSDLLPTVSVPASSGIGGARTSQAARGKKSQGEARTLAKTEANVLSISEALQQAVGSTNAPSQPVPMVTAYIQESDDGPILPQKEIKRRVSHNEVEKRRRDKINNWINKLARLVPAANDESGKTAQSKGGVLAKTVDYIQELKSTTSDIQKFRNQIRDLTRENKVLKQRLIENGISAPVVAKTTMTSSQSQASSGQGTAQRNQTPVNIAPKGRLIPVNLSSSGTVLLLSQDAATGAFSLNRSTPVPQLAAEIEEESMEMQL